jgi:hypothetical protein
MQRRLGFSFDLSLRQIGNVAFFWRGKLVTLLLGLTWSVLKSFRPSSPIKKVEPEPLFFYIEPGPFVPPFHCFIQEFFY